MKHFIRLFLLNFLWAMPALANTCNSVWPTGLTQNSTSDFSLRYDLGTSTDEYYFTNRNYWSMATGTYTARRFEIRNAQMAFSGNGPTTIYADEVEIRNATVNVYQPNPLIIIANTITIVNSDVNAAIYTYSSSSRITNTGLVGAVTSPTTINYNPNGNNNSLSYDSFYFSNSGFGEECGDPNATHTFFDKFNQISYANNDGEQSWAQDWIETNDGSSSPTAGAFIIDNGRLRLNGPNKEITRAADLSRYREATLSFDYTTDTNARNDIVYLEATTSSGNSAWNQLQVFEQPGNRFDKVSIDLPEQYINSNFRVRFRTSTGFEESGVFADYMWIDNFAIDGSGMALSCPNTSSYTEIFNDDFATVKSGYTAVNFDRTSSVWPGDSVEEDNSEDRAVDYRIANGRLEIEGDFGDNSRFRSGNNEYGAVLHDLSTVFYDAGLIDEYSIEVDMFAPTGNDGYLNNDAGVIFGYQDDRNFYVVKWTKYGNRFQNERDYPGIHKNLDLIKVQNGVATSLDSVSDYNMAYPSRVKITVNGDGVVICFDNGATLAAPAEQPFLQRYGYFTYENEEGISFDNVSVKCKDCTPVLQCEDTSAYSLIFQDDFNSFASQSNWTAVTFDRSRTRVWPNDTIWSDNQVRDIRFNVLNGKLNLAGQASSLLQNEYGVVLHDVVDEGYDDTLITTYSVSADLTAFGSSVNNNDTGLVFGYQDDTNFYLARWTKYSPNYRFDRFYPGTYRDLEIIKVVNGNPTQLGVVSNFYEPDDIEVKVTVNENGITLCINGRSRLVIANERPSMGQIGVFSYDNDIGVSFDNFEVRCQGCTQGSGVDHYRILHPQQGLTCSAYDITVAACQDASCSSYSTETVSGNVTKTFNSSSENILAVNTDTGIASGRFEHKDAGTVTFDFANASPEADNPTQCVTGSIASGTATNCTMTFADTGLLLTVNDFESASGWQAFSVQAVRKDDITQNCAPAISGNRDINFRFQYDTPATPADNTVNLAYAQAGATPVPNGELSNNVTATRTLNFSNTDATAQFYVDYADVGRLNLTVTDATPNSPLSGDSKTFVVYPSWLTVGLSDASNQYLGAAGNLTHFAKQPFNLAVQARNALGNPVKNYQPGNFEMVPHMSAPLIANGARATLFTYANSESLVVNNDASNWSSVQSAIGASFNQDGYVYAGANFDDVGTFSLNVRDTNYFGRSIVRQETNPADAGRMTPYYFAVTELRKGELAASLVDNGVSFTYIGQTMPYHVTPQFTFVAKDFTGGVANNYGGAGDTGQTFNFASSFDDRVYQETAENNDKGFDGGDLTSGSVSYSENENYDGTFVATLSGDTFTYDKSTTLLAPFNSNITLTLSAADLTDADAVGHCEEPLDTANTNCPTTYQPLSMELTVAPEMRYGRLFLDNVAGPENKNLYVPAYVQYWDGNTWLNNINDSGSNFSGLTGTLTGANAGNFNYQVDTTERVGNVDMTEVNFSRGEINSGFGLLINPNQNIAAELTLELDNVPVWLNMDWNGDNVLDGSTDKVSATAVFGSFSSNKRIIYKRER